MHTEKLPELHHKPEKIDTHPKNEKITAAKKKKKKKIMTDE